MKMNKERLLITGANGFVGTNLMPLLKDYDVTTWDLTDGHDIFDRDFDTMVNHADKVIHLVSYPMAASSPMTVAPPLTAITETFSKKMNLGLSSPARRMISRKSPLRVPSPKPAPAPATLMSWQGNPPKMMSMEGSISPRSVVTSSQIGAVSISPRSIRESRTA